jgi:excisionase family DNA binding protein
MQSSTLVVTNMDALAEGLRLIVREEVQRLANLEPSPWLDVKDAGVYTTFGEQSIRALVKRREIPFEKAPNGRILFRRDELDAWITARSA